MRMAPWKLGFRGLLETPEMQVSWGLVDHIFSHVPLYRELLNFSINYEFVFDSGREKT